MCLCLQEAQQQVSTLEDDISKLKELSGKLAEHFCEDPKTFQLEEFLSTFKDFCEKVKQCSKVGRLVVLPISETEYTVSFIFCL